MMLSHGMILVSNFTHDPISLTYTISPDHQEYISFINIFYSDHCNTTVDWNFKFCEMGGVARENLSISFVRSICKYENNITKNLLCQYTTRAEWKKNSSSKNIHHFTFELFLLKMCWKKNEKVSSTLKLILRI